MSRQITPARYARPEVRDHLAGHYLLGLLSRRVSRRFEQLLARDPSLWLEIERWQERLPDPSPPFRHPPARVWRHLQMISEGKNPPGAIRRWMWNSGWLALGAMMMFLSLTPLTPSIKPVSYLAMMSSAECHDCFVLMAFQGDKPGKSSIRVQYGEQSPAALEGASLWMRDKTSGELIYLAPMAQLGTQRYLTPGEWNQLKNSDELVVKQEGQTLFSGRCITL
ncbi:MAG: hypothetical protein ACRCWW_20605 [Scandinavium sp.]|uniref:hypothetical protein n=1 Tax=Scandinavium sp. TaxID=2830653 RepID=UPI003F2E1437